MSHRWIKKNCEKSTQFESSSWIDSYSVWIDCLTKLSRIAEDAHILRTAWLNVGKRGGEARTQGRFECLTSFGIRMTHPIQQKKEKSAHTALCQIVFKHQTSQLEADSYFRTIKHRNPSQKQNAKSGDKEFEYSCYSIQQTFKPAGE